MRQREATSTGLASPGCAAPSGFRSPLTLRSSRSPSNSISSRWHPWGFPFRGLFLLRCRQSLPAYLPLVTFSVGEVDETVSIVCLRRTGNPRSTDPPPVTNPTFPGAWFAQAALIRVGSVPPPLLKKGRGPARTPQLPGKSSRSAAEPCSDPESGRAETLLPQNVRSRHRCGGPMSVTVMALESMSRPLRGGVVSPTWAPSSVPSTTVRRKRRTAHSATIGRPSIHFGCAGV